MSDEDLVARLRKMPVRVQLSGSWERDCYEAADALEHWAQSHDALVQEVERLTKERDEARHHAQARLVALREVEDEIRYMLDTIKVLVNERDADRATMALLRKWDALIRHQYSGSREAMSEMTACAQETAKMLYGDAPWPTRISGDDNAD